EALALATHWGGAPEDAPTILGESPTTTAALRAKLATMFDSNAPAEFALHLARKDLWLATTAAYQQTVALPQPPPVGSIATRSRLVSGRAFMWSKTGAFLTRSCPREWQVDGPLVSSAPSPATVPPPARAAA